MLNAININIDRDINEKYIPLLEDKNRYMVLWGGAGSGKCLGKNTEVVMCTGELKKVQDIIPGDLLLGPDNLPRKVLEINKGYGKLFEVKQNKGSTYIVNEEHILSLHKGIAAKKDKGIILKSGNYKNSNGRYSYYDNIVNISIKEYLKKSNRWKRNFYGYRASNIEFEEKNIKIDPYFLGVWLGDGSSDVAPRTGAWIETYFISKGYLGGKCNILRQYFKDYNLFYNKHIPNDYLYNTSKIRMELLAGLVDSDGYLRGNCYEIIAKNEHLAKQIQYLCHSLGLRCSLSISIKQIKSIGFSGIYYRMHISGNTQKIPVKIKRKKIIKFNKKCNPYITGIKINEIGEGEYYGFELSGDGLFLLKDFTVTHNSHYAAQKHLIRILLSYHRGYKEKFLILRKTKTSIRDSVFALFNKYIDDWGMRSIVNSNKTTMD